MIFSNVNLRAYSKFMSFGNLICVTLGEHGKGRIQIVVPCPDKFVITKNNVLKGYSIGLSKSGNPKIVPQEDNKLYLFLSSGDGYTRRSNVVIYCSKEMESCFKLMDSGNGADGAAGKIGTWTVCVVEVVKFPAYALIKYAGTNRISIIIASAPDEVTEIDTQELSNYIAAVCKEYPHFMDISTGNIKKEIEITCFESLSNKLIHGKKTARAL